MEEMSWLPDPELKSRGQRVYREIEQIKEDIEVGDTVWLALDHLAFETDNRFADGFWFRVAKKYTNCVLLEKSCPKGQTHRQSVDYTTLWMFAKMKKQSGKWLRGRVKIG